MSAGVLVAAEGVGRTFGSGADAVVAVSEATLRLTDGDRVALVGPSGSGKSTLLHLLAGLDRPSRGTVTWPAIGDLADVRRGGVGVVFQGATLLPALDVLANVALPLQLAGVDRDEARARARAALDLVDIGHLADRLPDDLSAGQAQRAAVARAMAPAPRVIVADEPTGRLDSAAARVVVDVLLAAADATSAGLIVSTHDRSVAARLGIEWHMEDGRLSVMSGVGPADR